MKNVIKFLVVAWVVALTAQTLNARKLGILNWENADVQVVISSIGEKTVPKANKGGAGSALAGLGYKAGSLYFPEVPNDQLTVQLTYRDKKPKKLNIKADNKPILIDVDFKEVAREYDKDRVKVLIDALQSR